MKFYFELGPYPRIDTRIGFGGAATATQHLTLPGAVQNFLDGIHMELRSRADLARYGVELDGAWAQQTQLTDVNSQIDAIARFWPRMYPDTVPAGQTAEGIAAQYKNEAAALFAAYGF